MNPQVQSGFLFEDASGRKAVPPVSASPELWHCPDPFLSNREMPVLSAGTCPHADAGKRKAGRTACLRARLRASPAEFRRLCRRNVRPRGFVYKFCSSSGVPCPAAIFGNIEALFSGANKKRRAKALRCRILWITQYPYILSHRFLPAWASNCVGRSSSGSY